MDKATIWTEDLVRRVRVHAARGATRAETAIILKISYHSLKMTANRLGIKFVTAEQTQRRGANPYPSPSIQNAKALPKAALFENCRLARQEAATPPLYRGAPTDG